MNEKEKNQNKNSSLISSILIALHNPPTAVAFIYTDLKIRGLRDKPNGNKPKPNQQLR